MEEKTQNVGREVGSQRRGTNGMALERIGWEGTVWERKGGNSKVARVGKVWDKGRVAWQKEMRAWAKRSQAAISEAGRSRQWDRSSEVEAASRRRQ